MIFNSKLKQELELTKSKLQTAELRFKNADTRYNDFIQILQNNLTKAPVSLDFIGMNAFSIERVLDANKIPHTIIGYFVKNKEGNPINKEWYLYCSEEIHSTLVTQFNEYVEKKYSRYHL